jgi:biopolymer transport protein ExbB/TolQ
MNAIPQERVPTPSISPFFAKLWDLPDRRMVLALSAACALCFIAFLTIALNPSSRAAALMLDRESPHFVYPFTIQNFEHIFFFMALGELFVRWRIAVRELAFVTRAFLPEDEHTVLQVSDLGPLRRRVAKEFDGEHGFLPSLINLSILQFQSSRSIDQTVAVMNSSLGLMEHRVDLRYGLVRYIAWLVPTLGFIGTVIGLGSSLAKAGASASVSVQAVAGMLAVGFDCTMVALAESAILVFILQLVQEKEETSLNLAGDYTLRNLINRLYEGRPAREKAEA